MKNEDDIEILICVRTAGTPRPVYGSIRANCAECKSPIWVSQSGQKALKTRKNLQLFCLECGHKKMEESDEEVQAEIVPGAVEELKRHFLKIAEN